MVDASLISEYAFDNPTASHTDAYLLPIILKELENVDWPLGAKHIFELGCGNGATAASLAQRGYEVLGVDPSAKGVAVANNHFPNLSIHIGSCYDDLAGQYGQYPVVLSLEVVEHVFLPRKYAQCVFDLLKPGGMAIISTPYHGYLKNLAIALTGKMDAHFSALWDYGHVKFWSIRTLTELLQEAGLEVVRFHRVGRIPALAKSMIAIARRPA